MDCLANQKPPWDAYQVFMSSCLIALYKLPGVNPVGVREIWGQIFANCVLKVTESEANHACKDDQICTGLKYLIYRAVHGVQCIWESNSTKENWVFLLVDAKNSFNDINRFRILWKVRHLWHSGACSV